MIGPRHCDLGERLMAGHGLGDCAELSASQSKLCRRRSMGIQNENRRLFCCVCRPCNHQRDVCHHATQPGSKGLKWFSQRVSVLRVRPAKRVAGVKRRPAPSVACVGIEAGALLWRCLAAYLYAYLYARLYAPLSVLMHRSPLTSWLLPV